MFSSTEVARSLEWQTVQTDAKNFTVVLVNQDSSVLSEPIVLAENVDASKDSLDIDAPEGGWPVFIFYHGGQCTSPFPICFPLTHVTHPQADGRSAR